jgi:hypothetical protein
MRPGLTILLLVAAVLPACSGPGGNTNDNDNSTPSETRDFSSFTVFIYDAGPLACAELNRVALATIVDLREQELGVRADLAILESGNAEVEECAPAPAERGCLVLRGPQTVFLSDEEIETVLQTFSAVQVLLESETDCAEDRCVDSFEWDAGSALSSARCAPAPRLSASQAQTITTLLESLRAE